MKKRNCEKIYGVWQAVNLSLSVNCSKIIILLIMLLSVACNGQHPNTSCMENPGPEGKLFVFIGEKIDVKSMPHEPHSMDNKFVASYKVLETICGKYNNEVIDFIVYDHYGNPAFEKYKNVILFLSQLGDTFYHQKYQYFAMYKTKDGRWASPYSTEDYGHAYNKNTSIKPVKIEFENEVSFDLTGISKKEIKLWYPQPYYTITNNKAIATWGNYVPELFQLKKDGVLRARELFGNPDSLPLRQEIKLLEQSPVNIPYADSIKLIATWRTFLSAISKKNTDRIKQMSLSNVMCAVCEGMPENYYYNDIEPIDSFIANSYTYLPNSQLWKKMTGKQLDVSAYEHPDFKPENHKLREGEVLVVYLIVFKTITQFENSRDHKQSHEFQFVKINGEYKFYGMESLGISWPSQIKNTH